MQIFIQKWMALLKPNEMKAFIKYRAFLIREGDFNKRLSEAYRRMEKGGAAPGSV
jgi:hypothetical protein